MKQNIQLSPEKRKLLADMLHDWVDASDQEKSGPMMRWEKNRSQYDDIPLPFVSRFLKNCADKCFPFARPRLQALADNVLTAVFSQDPVLAASQRTSKQAQIAIEQIVQYFFERGRIEEVCKTIHPDVGCTNHGIVRMVLDPDEMLFRFDPIDPDEFIILGSACYNVRTAIMAGHAFYPTKGEVLERIKAGEYDDHPDMPGLYEPNEEPMHGDRASTLTSTAGVTDDLSEPTKLYYMSFHCDVNKIEDRKSKRGKDRVSTKKETYIAVFDKENRHVLSLRKSSQKTHPYYTFSYLPAPKRGYWSDRSVGRDLQELHDCFQIANNMMLYGHLMDSFKPVLSKGPFARNQTITPGGAIASMGGDLTIPNTSYDPKQLSWFIQHLENQGEGAIRISQAGLAQSQQTSKTATQVQNEAMNQAVGKSGYVQTWVIPLCEMAREIVIYVAAMWPEFKDAHGEALPEPIPQTVGGMEIPPTPGKWTFGNPNDVDFEAVGASPSSNPATVLQNGMMLLQMADKYPEIKKREALETVLSGTGLRNAGDLLYTEEEMAQMQAQMMEQQAMMAQQDAQMKDESRASEHEAFQAGLNGEPNPSSEGESGMEGIPGMVGAASRNGAFGSPGA